MGKNEIGEGKREKKEVEEVTVVVGKEGENLLGRPRFKKLKNGRVKCIETGHELPAKDRFSYSKTKHCRIGLINSALSLSKPPLNMFEEDPFSRSKLICKLTGQTVNKTEEHIWKHINGKKFLSMLEKKETEEQTSNGLTGDGIEQKQDIPSKRKRDGEKKKKKEKEKLEVESQVNKEGDGKEEEEEDFWIPPVGESWDLDKGGDRRGSDSESGPEIDNETTVLDGVVGDGKEESKDDEGEHAERTKKTDSEIGFSDLASKQKKKKRTKRTDSESGSSDLASKEKKKKRKKKKAKST